MTTVWPGAVDSYSVKVDNVDDVLAAHINNPQDAIVALETPLRDMSLMRVKNTSGSTVAANDVGYIDEAGEFKLNTTDFLDGVDWAVVVDGGVNNADIICTNKGLVTVICNGNVTAGQLLYLSTTTKQVQPQSYVRPGIMAVAKTANTGGAGGTCVALLLCDRKPISMSNASYIWSMGSAHSGSDFVSVINGAPGATTVVYGAVANGNEEFIDPAASLLTRMRLYNSDRANYALISSVNLGTNTITVSAAADISDWEDTDDILVRSQTAVLNIGAGYLVDLEINDATVVPALAVAVVLSAGLKDTGGAGERFTTHPWIAHAASQRFDFRAEVANSLAEGTIPPIILYQRRFTFLSTASGGGTISNQFLNLRGVIVAAP